MVNIRNNFERLSDLGARLAAVIAEDFEEVQEYAAKHNFQFPVLVDEEREIARSYGTYVRLNLESVNISRQAQFVIDREGNVRFMYVGSHQRDFVPVRHLLKVVRRLNEQEHLLV